MPSDLFGHRNSLRVSTGKTIPLVSRIPWKPCYGHYKWDVTRQEEKWTFIMVSLKIYFEKIMCEWWQVTNLELRYSPTFLSLPVTFSSGRLPGLPSSGNRLRVGRRKTRENLIRIVLLCLLLIYTMKIFLCSFMLSVQAFLKLFITVISRHSYHCNI